jgi:hypothetical protein
VVRILPITQKSLNFRETVIQPYVQIILRGHPADERDYTTKVVPKVRRSITIKYFTDVIIAVSQ